MSPIRLLVDPPAAGSWNMAVDEMLLETASDHDQATLRLYRWTPATLSLGYFQHAADREVHRPSNACPLVRRSSGGGALVHDRELTYSLTLPLKHPLASDPETLYRETHGLLLRTLGRFGIDAKLNEQALVALGGEPFLCFQRRAVGDVLVGAHKICGSAQRRSKAAVLQHGGVLVAASPCAPELPGLAELTSGAAPSIDELAEAWLDDWRAWLAGQRLTLADASTSLAEAELDAARRIQSEKYAAITWTKRR
jgi:lipoate-protein ligase A